MRIITSSLLRGDDRGTFLLSSRRSVSSAPARPLGSPGGPAPLTSRAVPFPDGRGLSVSAGVMRQPRVETTWIQKSHSRRTTAATEARSLTEGPNAPADAADVADARASVVVVAAAAAASRTIGTKRS